MWVQVSTLLPSFTVSTSIHCCIRQTGSVSVSMYGYAKSRRRTSRRHDLMVHADWHQATATEYGGLCNERNVCDNPG
ncbi:hypothetical protein BD311DRAFT_178330 [Dichomitus squalens]|uniref:Uncharacterized protein n=1 Tax=Dichomitus squalens TaxID=114155 RepID=A0A4Q9M8A7_9APHY|nr:hypothetical protein BD311DRAFT_178330 [Dichomitus squalens]